MAPILTKDKIKEFLAARNDIAIPILSLVKDGPDAFPLLQLAATGAMSFLAARNSLILSFVKMGAILSRVQVEAKASPCSATLVPRQSYWPVKILSRMAALKPTAWVQWLPN